MKIGVIGTGYVGLVTGTCLAELGNSVVCADIDSEKIWKLNGGIIPIYEPGLEDLVKRNRKEGRLFFVSSIKNCVEDSEIIFICVGTPQGKNGVADLSYVESAAVSIAESMNGYKIIVTKSTIPVGSTHRIKKIMTSRIGNKCEFDVVSNPEFLREGEAVNDFMIPDRIVIGADNEKSRKIMENLYGGISRTNRQILFTDIRSSEMIKYASNSMLACRISFMNELSRLCEKVGADVKEVSKGIGLDNRIGPRFLQAGAGYGGSCFGKDVRALINTMGENSVECSILDAVDKVNLFQRKLVFEKIKSLLGSISGKKVAVWGLSFKPKTDDMRDAPSIDIIRSLQLMGAKITAFDPVAVENSRKILLNVEYAEDMYSALDGSDALVVITEWNEFRNPDFSRMKSLMKSPNIVDARNIYSPIDMAKEGFNYIGIGRGIK